MQRKLIKYAIFGAGAWLLLKSLHRSVGGSAGSDGDVARQAGPMTEGRQTQIFESLNPISGFLNSQ